MIRIFVSVGLKPSEISKGLMFWMRCQKTLNDKSTADKDARTSFKVVSSPATPFLNMKAWNGISSSIRTPETLLFQNCLFSALYRALVLKPAFSALQVTVRLMIACRMIRPPIRKAKGLGILTLRLPKAVPPKSWWSRKSMVIIIASIELNFRIFSFLQHTDQSIHTDQHFTICMS